MSTIDTRREQMFPKLEPREIDRLRRFGDVRRYSAGEALFVTGEIAPGMVVLTKGSLRVTRRDPLGHHAPMAEQGVGEFVAEVGQLSGQPAFVDVHAIDDVEALLIPPENLRALVIAEPELGERIMRALILRRVALVEAGAGGPVLIGPESAPDVIRLQGFLARNAYPHQLLDPTQDGDAAELVKQYAPNPADLPLAVCPKGSILKNPSETELAGELGMVPIDCKIACNIDPLRGLFAPNTDPRVMSCVSVLPFGPAGPGRALGNDWRGEDRRDSTRLF